MLDLEEESQSLCRSEMLPAAAMLCGSCLSAESYLNCVSMGGNQAILTINSI